ncbi:HEAT repeat domain-containing protein [Geobacter sp. SVR]|uniref:HEAT repeat domain-containing protein n=1 Tax=Geobacter sp. SVR TaxID=2495594 RepID=UPI00143F0104|nr:HEAT repeat domain-containing protein [Geobacter sp. SVR]BCS53849.1 PBS lyase [Geobacter sp. SVR]GCF85642.1 PBS lyase [Geobacter sp. SVR]
MESHADIRQALRSSDEETRREAVHALRGKSLSESRDALFVGLADVSWRVRKEAVDVFVAADPEEACITDLLEFLRNGDNAGLRNSAAEAIIRLGLRAATPLIGMVHDDEADVRKFVVDVMGTIADAGFVPVLLATLSDPDVNVAAAAAEHLGNIGDSSVVPALIDSIIGNDALIFRFSALTALGKLSSHLAVPAEIIALAKQDILRASVYECLGSIGDDSVAPILLKGFRSRQKSSRRSAITAWYRIFSRSSVTARAVMENSLLNLKGSTVLPLLIESFDAEDAGLAEAVTAILGITGDTRSATTLLNAFANERYTGIALTSLKRLGEDGLAALLTLYQEADEVSRSAICTVVGELACPTGSDVIQEALGDASPMVRKAAASAAGRLGMTDCISTVVSLLEDSDPEVTSVAIACLKHLAALDRNAIQNVVRELGVSDQAEKRRNAAVLSATLGDGDTLSLLVKDEDPGVRQIAVSAIGSLHLPVHCSVLLLALVDEDPDVRIAAAEALGEVGGTEVVEPLVHAMEDEDCWVQCAVLRAIAGIEQDRAFSVMESLVPHAEELLMVTCLELLESIGNRAAFELVETVLDHPDHEIMMQAVGILTRQGGEWLGSNAERLLSHPNHAVRAAWIDLVAGLPAEDARHFLSRAEKIENDPQLRLRIVRLLESLT